MRRARRVWRSFATLTIGALGGCAFLETSSPEPELRTRILPPPEPVSSVQAESAPARATAPESAPARVGPSALPPSHELTLSEAIDYAYRLSPGLEVVRKRVARAEGGRMVALAGLLPDVRTSYRHIEGTQSFALPTLPTLVGNVAYGGDADRFRQAELAVQWLVWDFGASLGRYGQSDAAAEIAELAYERARQTLAFDVSEAYFDLLDARATRRIADEAVRNARSILDDSRNFLQQGTALREDVLRADVQLAQMELDLVESRTREAQGIAALNRIIGFNVSSPTRIADRRDEPDMDATLPQCLQRAVEHRDEFRVALRAIDSARLGMGAAQADFLPRVMVGGTGINVSRPGPLIEENVFTGGVNIELALFDGGKRLGELDSASAELAETIARAKDVCDAIAFEVVSAYLMIQDRREAIRLGRRAVDRATENLRVVRDLFRGGDATSTDVVDGELALIRSQEDYASALYGYQAAIARLEYAMGTRSDPDLEGDERADS